MMSFCVATSTLGNEVIVGFFPVRSSSLSPGLVTPRRFATGVTRPLFLLGTDRTSIAWLTANHDRVRQLNAVGLVIEAPNAAAVEALQAIVTDVPLHAVPGNALAAHFGLRHYPVLITANGLSY